MRSLFRLRFRHRRSRFRRRPLTVGHRISRLGAGSGRMSRLAIPADAQRELSESKFPVGSALHDLYSRFTIARRFVVTSGQ